MHSTRRQPLPLPSIPRTQALDSATFSPPPLDGSLCIPELFDWHYQKSPDHTLFVYPNDDGANMSITWKDAVRAIYKAGHMIRALANGGSSSDGQRLVFGIVASNDTIPYYTLIAAILRAGHIAFPISPRNSPAAVAHLLRKTNTAFIFVGREDANRNLVSSALQELRDSELPSPKLSPFPLFDDLYESDLDAPLTKLPPLDFNWDDPLVIVHSSGSTSFPKPIIYTHKRLLLTCLVPWFGERDLTGQKLGLHSMPMYHGLGVIQIGWTASSGIVLTVFKSQVPPMIPSAESVLKAVVDTRSDYVFCVPSFIELWSAQPDCVAKLRDVQGIIYSGGPLSKRVGDGLIADGVKIIVMYGNSECGINSVVLPKETGPDWEYFKFPACIKPHFVHKGDGNAELVLLSHELQQPCVVNTEYQGCEGYATSDLLSPHPTKPGYWKIYGREDDQIMHCTGEKTNPTPLEILLTQDPHIRSAVIFGRGRFNAGVLVDPVPAEQFDITDEEKLVEFRTKIWPTVEKVNEFAPQHSRIFKEMIIVTTPSKPFMYTAKNTARRQAILSAYEAEINALYVAVDETTQSDLLPPASWDLASTHEFVRAVITKVLKRDMQDSDDLFQHGCDSLQAVWIRNTIMHALGKAANTRSIGNTFVYAHPTIGSLAQYVSDFARSAQSSSSRARELSIQEMKGLVEKYSSNLPVHATVLPHIASDGDVVILTGTTGFLGTSLLIELVACPHVKQIYALNRQGATPTLERQRRALLRRSADLLILASPKIIWQDADLQQPFLGLSTEALNDIRRDVTHIIHNSWPVNFNHPLKSQESSIHGLRNLVDLALSSFRKEPPRLVFCSSASVAINMLDTPAIREVVVEPSAATGNGYTESKWVAERLLEVVSERTALRPITIRIGQLSGTSTGYWKPTEWFPSLVRSSVFLKCFPSIDKSISLLPVDDAARVICEMRNSTIPLLHLSHPHSTPWRTIRDAVASALELQTVPYNVWFGLLKKSGDRLQQVEAAQENPGLKLLEFFRQANVNVESAEAMGIPKLDMTVSLTVSPYLREMGELEKDSIQVWVKHWRESGLLQ